MTSIPKGFCHCGCGGKTGISKRNKPEFQQVKGQPVRFLPGHGRSNKPVGSTPPPNPSGVCMCGCGDHAPIATYTDHARGFVAGHAFRFIAGHQKSLSNIIPEPNPSGFCMCGCGNKTSLATQTDIAHGRVKGKPVCYLHNHHGIKKHPPIRIEDRGYKTPCWIWTKSLTRDGYGQAHENGKMRKAHAVFYERKHGPIPKGLEPDHLCRVRPCVNPEHIEPVTRQVNAQRRATKKLDPNKVKEIRSLHSVGHTIRSLAKRYSVCTGTIHMVVHRHSWDNVE